MPVSEAKKRANAKWNSKNYDKMTFHISKGKKDIIKSHATKQGLSLNAFVVRAIDEAIQKDTGLDSETADMADV